MTTTRTFEDRPAVREATPLFVGLIGPSGAGKTFSALRLAVGIQRVSGGEIFGIDTEARRMLHYADKFKFRHTPFGAPFGPLEYLAAIEHCVARGAKTIIVDSMSHEHEGPGGVLEMHDVETARLAKLWGVSEEKAQIAAWNKPKQQRRRLINTILQINANFVFCFRAKEKLKVVKGKPPEELGFMPQAGEEFVYEMALKCLLLPGSDGTPTWQSEYRGEKLMIKLPEQFRHIFGNGKNPQLTEDVGQKLAEWAAGTKSHAPAASPLELLARFDACSDPATLRTLEEERAACWPSCKPDVKAKLKAASESAAKRIAEANAPPPSDDDAPGEPPPNVSDDLGPTMSGERL